MPGRTKGLLINIILLLLSILVSLIAVEGLLRVFSSESAPRLGFLTSLCEHDPLLGWKKIPNEKIMHVHVEYTVVESFNSKGIRGPEYLYDKIGDEYRILILGDSFAQGYTVEFNKLFSEVLKEKLNDNRDKYCEVINAATAGYSTDQELLFFQTEGMKYSPDVTVLMFCQNDVLYNNQTKYWLGSKPLFRIENGKLVLANVPVPEPVTQSTETQPFFERVNKWLNEKSYLYNFIITRIPVRHLYALVINLGLVGNGNEVENRDEIIRIPAEFRVWEKTYNDVVQDAWSVTEAIIMKLKEEADLIGSKLLIFYIPSRGSINEEAWAATKNKYGISDEDWNVGQVGIELKIMGKPETDLEEIKSKISEKLKVQDSKVEPLAFGLKALKILVVTEDKGGTDEIEKMIKEIEGVDSVEVENVTLI